jgi:hypothetical protein
VIVVSIAYLGDTGLTLWADFIAPLVAIGLYALWRRAGDGRHEASA